jgi:glucans biosynthesis protein C
METVTPGSPVSGIARADIPLKATSRLYFIDNIRVFLTILVVLHHLMIAFSGTGSWYYSETGQDLLTQAIGAWFCATNQAYFMGLFLLISAYFIPGSFDRKGAGQFLKDRLIRLGIPLAVYSWVINPVFVYAVSYKDIQKPFWQYFPGEYFSHNSILGNGPLWFVEVLLIFTLVYLAWRRVGGSRPVAPTKEAAFPGNGMIAVFALLLGMAGFLIRIPFPMDAYTFQPLNLQFGFFVQYIALFVMGLIAYRRNWLSTLSDRSGIFWLRIAALLVAVWLPMVLACGIVENDNLLKGGWHWQSLLYALWESFLCVGMCIGLIYVFRRHFNRRGAVSGFLIPNAYTAYIIHAPVITALAFAVHSIPVYPLLKWVVVGLVAVPMCFGLSSLIRKLPFMDRVL